MTEPRRIPIADDDVNAHLRDVPCRCGHALENHNHGFGQMHSACLVAGCDCNDYYPDRPAPATTKQPGIVARLLGRGG